MPLTKRPAGDSDRLASPFEPTVGRRHSHAQVTPMCPPTFCESFISRAKKDQSKYLRPHVVGPDQVYINRGASHFIGEECGKDRNSQGEGSPTAVCKARMAVRQTSSRRLGEWILFGQIRDDRVGERPRKKPRPLARRFYHGRSLLSVLPPVLLTLWRGGRAFYGTPSSLGHMACFWNFGTALLDSPNAVRREPSLLPAETLRF